ncbi:MAG: GAF domain-containing protein [Tunicatimonas sp.]|uniref:GAF domain-containing protein n=1 Tax=Tunicatimonas sp. TaxID=1940096 RepID=UPI003C71E871
MQDELSADVSTSLLSKIVNTGSHHDLPEYLRKRVQPTNIICLLIIFVLAIPFVGISLIYFPWLAIFPAGGGLTSLVVIYVNSRGGIKYSRIVLPVLCLLLASLYNAYFSTSMYDALISIYMVELSFTLIPFVVFDLKERGYLIFCSIFSFFIILVFPLIWHLFDMGYDGTVLRTGWVSIVAMVLAVCTQLGTILGLAVLNRQSEKESEQSRLETEERNQNLLIEREENTKKTKELEAAQAEEKKRQWATEGITQISEIIRKAGKNENIFDQLVAATVKFVRANQGGLFVVDRSHNDNTTIELAACYAYERKKFTERTIAPGEGLVGQVFLEREYSYFTEIPEDYVNITSGLGKANPTSLLIVPLMVNDTVEGIMEVAGFHAFEDYEIEFLRKLGEVIASFIQNERVMQRTTHLLNQAQEQSEEMRAQEEEMRQNMEEIQATQEEMHRKEKEYQSKIHELEQRLVTDTAA